MGVYFRGNIAYIRYKDADGTIVRESTNQGSRQLAKKLLDKRKTELAEAKAFPSRKFQGVKFAELLDAWWSRVPGVKHEKLEKKTRSGFEYLLPKIREKFAVLKAREISTTALQDWLDALEKDGKPLGPSSKNHYRTVINLVFNTAIKRGLYDINPCSGVPQYREPSGRDLLVVPSRFRDLLIELEEDKELYVAVLVLAVLNLRKMELLARKWSDVHLEEPAFLLVPTTKNNRPKKIPLPDAVVDALETLPSFGVADYLFPSRGTARHPEPKRPYRWDIGKQFRAAVKAVGLAGLRVHDLKHVAPSLLLAKGVDETLVRKLTGHRSNELWRYQHLMPKLREMTVDALASELLKPDK